MASGAAQEFSGGRLWDIGYRFAQAPKQVVQFQQFGNTVSISAAGSPVTVSTSGGCTIVVATPARFTVPTQNCL